MKTTIVEKKDVKVKSEFPCMRRSIEYGTVVLFSNSTTGVVVFSTPNGSSLGYWQDEWANYSNANIWEPVNDITINFKMD